MTPIFAIESVTELTPVYVALRRAIREQRAAMERGESNGHNLEYLELVARRMAAAIEAA